MMDKIGPLSWFYVKIGKLQNLLHMMGYYITN
jgi:hypothetical protein